MALSWSDKRDRRVIEFLESDAKLHAKLMAKLHPDRRAPDRPTDEEFRAKKEAR